MMHLLCHICLALTVQNDSSVIDRHLESVKEIVDSIAICDLGSTDSTLKQIDAFAKKYNFPLYVKSAPWNSLDSPRDLALNAACEVCAAEDYILLADPDLIYSAFDKTSLTEDVYALWTPSPLFAFARYEPTLLRASCAGKNLPALPLDTLRLQVGGSAWHKFQRLEKRAVVLTRPSLTPSDLFELANIHHELKHFKWAIALYRQRIEWKADREEVWLSKYRLAECLEGQGQSENALHWYFAAMIENPMHKEPFLKAAISYRLRGENDLAYQFLMQGLEIPEGPRALSPLPLIEAYSWDQELSIVAYYTPFKEEGFRATNRLLLNRNVPPHIKAGALQNVGFYMQNLPAWNSIPIQPPPKSEEIYVKDVIAAQSLDLSDLRGFARLPWQEGYLILAHAGFHRLLHVDESWNLLAISLPFTFSHRGFESCYAMELDASGENLLCSVEMENQEARLFFIKMTDVLSLLHDVKNL